MPKAPLAGDGGKPPTKRRPRRSVVAVLGTHSPDTFKRLVSRLLSMLIMAPASRFSVTTSRFSSALQSAAVKINVAPVSAFLTTIE